MFSEARVMYLEWARRAQAAPARAMLLLSGASTPLSRLGVDPARLLADPAPGEFREVTVREVAARYGVPREEVFPALGTSLALFLAAAAILRPGDEALVETPGYESLRRVPEALGARAIPFPRRAAVDWGLEPDAILDRWTPRSRLVLVSDLHNPSGREAGDEALAQLAAHLTRHGGWLLVDEVYRDFRPGPVGTARRLGGNVLAVSSLTKVYGLGPLRLGWVLGPAEVVARLEGIQDVLHSVEPSVLGPLAGAAFRHADGLRENAMARAARGRTVLEAWAAGNPEFRTSLPAGSLHFWVGLPEGLTGTRVAERLLAEHAVAVAPGRFFGDDGGVRAGTPEDPAALALGLEALSRVARTTPAAPGG
jgi:aspartate/methionine/tyrosine aminotransferase